MDWFKHNKPLIIGHRGASADAPENTLAALVLAAEHGADGVEFDVQQTADGELVVIHDDTVDRTTNGTGVVTKMTLAQLRELDAGSGQSIPTLDEVFETLGQHILYNVEVKEISLRDRGTETAVSDRIHAHNLETRVIVSSFSPWAVRRARQHLTRSTPVALLREAGWQRFCYLLASGEADHPQNMLVDAAYMAWARQRGWRVNVWTVDEPVEAQRLVTLGVDGLITNKPKFLRQQLGL